MGLKSWYLKLPNDVQKDLNRLCQVCEKSCNDCNRGCLFKWNVYQFSKTKRACKFVEKYKNKLNDKGDENGSN